MHNMFIKENDEEQIELSVIIPVYNVEPYLVRCIASVLNQTYSVGEIICVDDGSTDNSLAILETYRLKDPRIKVVHKENGGLVSARKAGICIAKGEYVAYVDSDDWIEKNMYQDMMSLIKETHSDIVTSGCIRDYGSHCIMEGENAAPGVYEGDCLIDNLLSKMISTDCFFQGNISMHIFNKIYRRELLLNYQLLVDDYINVGEDAACVYPCLLSAEKVAVMGKSYYHYCMRSDSIMGTKRKDERDRCQSLFDGLKKECGKYIDKVPNIMMQLHFFRTYVLLLQHAEEIIPEETDFLFPFGTMKKEDRIVIYGAGRFGCELKSLLEKRGYCNIVAWVDKASKKEIRPLECLEELEYDKIIIAVLLSKVALEIKQELLMRNVEKTKICAVDYHLIEQKMVGAAGDGAESE